MAGENSLPGYSNVDLGSVLEALGTTKFSGSGSQNWVHVLNGLIIQGGTAAYHNGQHQTIDFNVAFTKQVLGVFICPLFLNNISYTFFVGSVTLQNFVFEKNITGSTTAYWLAIGV